MRNRFYECEERKDVIDEIKIVEGCSQVVIVSFERDWTEPVICYEVEYYLIY